MGDSGQLVEGEKGGIMPCHMIIERHIRLTIESCTAYAREIEKC